MAVTGVLTAVLTGCGPGNRRELVPATDRRPVVVVVAPVLNMSDSSAWDSLKVTDMVASELQTFDGVVVIPVNRALAALALRGQSAVETPEDALALAEELGADATVVTAVTEYHPYDPPRVGMVMQWYGLRRAADGPGFDPVSASRQASAVEPGERGGSGEPGPEYQVQRVFDAARPDVLEEVKAFARWRKGSASPYGWRVYLKSQELFVRYCCWSAIRSMLLARQHRSWGRGEPEADEWTRRGGA